MKENVSGCFFSEHSVLMNEQCIELLLLLVTSSI